MNPVTAFVILHCVILLNVSFYIRVSVNPFSLEANSRSREAVHCAPYKDTCSTTRPIIYEDGCRLHVPVVKVSAILFSICLFSATDFVTYNA